MSAPRGGMAPRGTATPEGIAADAGAPPLLDIRDLATVFRTEEGTVRAVDGISLTLAPGETLGLVGESGSGKSVANLSILRLIPDPPGRIERGQVLLKGVDLLKLPEREMRDLRGRRVAMVFQDPMTSLNPFLKVSRQLTEVLEVHEGLGRKAARERALDMLVKVGIPDAARRFDAYPHQFSGGMRQRVMIAMALLCKPELLLADEPTTALDVTIQAQILELMRGLTRELGTSVILVTHDLGVVAGMAQRVAVMYAGRIVELAPVEDLFAAPRHPYTIGLLRSLPARADAGGARRRLASIPGRPPNLAQLPPGCPFVPRCPWAHARCAAERPPLREVAPGQTSACWLDDPAGTPAEHPALWESVS
jgi:oligopeptide transport system ATP-binding protein